MNGYAFYFDGTRCTGCKTCELACKDYKDLHVGTAYRKVYEVCLGETTKDEQGCFTTSCVSYPLSLSCNHCENPACVKVCPTGAMHKEPEGVVTVSADRCVGCGYCHMACPYNVPKIDRALGHSVKCDACVERLRADKKPVCVEACPARALDFGPLDEMAQKGEQANIAPLPEPRYTDPHLFIKQAPDAKPSGDPLAVVVNPLEVQ